MGILEIFDPHHISFRDFKLFNHHTQEFNHWFLINFDKTFVINSGDIIADIRKRKRKYSIVKDFPSAFKKATIGKSYFFQ